MHPTDVARLNEFAERRRTLFAEDLAAGAVTGAADSRGATRSTRTLRLSRDVSIGVIRLEEPIERGQSVTSFELEGAADGEDFTPIARGTTIGYARLERFAGRRVRQVRLTIAGAADVRLRLYA